MNSRVPNLGGFGDKSQATNTKSITRRRGGSGGAENATIIALVVHFSLPPRLPRDMVESLGAWLSALTRESMSSVHSVEFGCFDVRHRTFLKRATSSSVGLLHRILGRYWCPVHAVTG